MRGNHGHRGRRDIGAERVEAAMGDVEDLQDAEYQRQPQRDDEQPRGLNQAVENDRQKEVHCAGFMPIDWRAGNATRSRYLSGQAPRRACRSTVERMRRSVALGAGHAALDPVERLHARRRIDAFGGKILDVDQIDPLRGQDCTWCG